jgi:hypothetical protein
MKTILFAGILACLAVGAKAQQTLSPADSLKYYKKEVAALNKKMLDSLQAQPLYLSYIQAAARSDNYRSMVLYASLYSANYDRLNAQAVGFAAISAPATGFGIGYSFKKNRRVFDVNVAAAGFDKTMKNNGEQISTSFGSMLQFELGYDLTKSNRVNIYPYAGIGLRMSRLQYEANASTNPAYTGPTNIIANNKSFNEMAVTLGYQAGLCFETVLTPASKPGGMMLFIKAGTNRPFSEKAFDIEGVRYDPNIKYGAMAGSIGFKFFGRY